MNIFDVLLRNFGARSRTRRPTDRVDCQAGFRGELTHESDLCTLCGTCAYVCSPGSITMDTAQEGGVWNFDLGRCTFCGRCVEYCPTQALSYQPQPARLFDQRAAQQVKHAVEYRCCSRCGATIRPLPIETLVRLYHSEEAARQALAAQDLCERCRGRVHSQHFKAAMGGKSD